MDQSSCHNLVEWILTGSKMLMFEALADEGTENWDRTLGQLEKFVKALGG